MDQRIIYSIGKRNALFSFFLIFVFCTTAHAARLHPEKYYQERWCEEVGGVVEYVLPDRTRVDCLTEEYAIEFDFANKWAEAIGQALYYGLMTQKKPGIVIIMEKKADQKYLKRLKKVTDIEDITVWQVAP